MPKERIVIVDILRGFALLLIILIHFVEHFDFFKSPQVNFLFSKEFDQVVTETTFLLISGKAYSVFAILFGLSYFIQMDNKAQKGIDYSKQFLWRMTVLLLLGFLYSLIYRGDILHIYALLSIPIIFLYKVKTKYLWIIAGLLVIQIPMIYNFVQTVIDPNYIYINPIKAYWSEGEVAYSTGSFIEVIQYNIWKGRLSVWSWSYSTGRVLQLIALFIVGLILGRKRVFNNIDKNRKGLIVTLIVSIVIIITLIMINNEFKASELIKLQKRFINTFLTSIINLAATSGIISLISLFYLKAKELYIFKLLAAYGKLSLTNYIIMGLFGAIFFYDFGFGMYRYLGATWSILLGGLVFFIQAVFSKYWNEKYYFGPIEWFWRCCTNLNFSIKIKRI